MIKYIRREYLFQSEWLRKGVVLIISVIVTYIGSAIIGGLIYDIMKILVKRLVGCELSQLAISLIVIIYRINKKR